MTNVLKDEANDQQSKLIQRISEFTKSPGSNGMRKRFKEYDIKY
jgi:hypothetical protein